MKSLTMADAPLETTYLGYTLKSLDKLWVVYTRDVWSTDEFYGNMLYYIGMAEEGLGRRWSYELFEDEVSVYSTRREAEAQAEEIRQHVEHSDNGGYPKPVIYVVNVGDQCRFERDYLDGKPYLERGRFRGSDAALAEMTEHWRSLR